MTIELTYPEGATSLDPDEILGLKPGLRTRGELNAFEQANIASAVIWAKNSRTLKKDLLRVDSLKLLHKHMFNETWKWAGKFRTTGKNLGCDAHLITEQLAMLCDDTKYWTENNVYPQEECAIRFHHRLVSIHPFPNGNGRHSRLAADLLLHFNRKTFLAWGGNSIDVEGAVRTEYLQSLRAADNNKYDALIKFALGTESNLRFYYELGI